MPMPPPRSARLREKHPEPQTRPVPPTADRRPPSAPLTGAVLTYISAAADERHVRGHDGHGEHVGAQRQRRHVVDRLLAKQRASTTTPPPPHHQSKPRPWPVREGACLCHRLLSGLRAAWHSPRLGQPCRQQRLDSSATAVSPGRPGERGEGLPRGRVPRGRVPRGRVPRGRVPRGRVPRGRGQHAGSASAASVASMRGSARDEPSACGMPVAMPTEMAETTCTRYRGDIGEIQGRHRRDMPPARKVRSAAAAEEGAADAPAGAGGGVKVGFGLG